MGRHRPVTPVLERLQRRQLKTSEIVARHLAAYVVDSGLAPGTAMPPEKEMMELLGVGRTTLREALRLLEVRGVLRIRSGPGGGPVVRRPKPDDLSGSLSLMLQFEGSSLEDVMDARMWLECTTARAAAARVTDEQIKELRRLNQMLVEVGVDDEPTFARGNEAFHGVIAQAAANVVLDSFLAALQSIADGRAIGITYPPSFRRAVTRQHAAIIDALQAGDADAADGAMRKHLNHSIRYWKREFAELVSRPIEWAF